MVNLKLLKDIFIVNIPNGITFGALTLSDIKELSGIFLAIVSAVCTIILTRHKLKQKDKY
jgi:hypothetical protein